ncbi:Hsp20/alpha crystallin family protein [Flavobacterium granuli]|uniref:HSP20 family protein n=1 Tax=Flavobacterium granuli TaxID=280093 RepID=A0A1M5TWZ5_9FLAO|nr:Hsp20/alpha crystallin family protein [Flavobacterium granuli]PRZ22886.1 HSP20 family protein [Flavobacterium granuli]SHH55181.1 HSP20 family protein [Flavobacterium granuli]
MEAIVKRNGFVPIVNTLFDDFLSRDLMDWNGKNFSSLGGNLPSVNLKETDKKIEVELAAPGLKKEDFKIEIDNNMLCISSEKKEEKEENSKKDNYYRKEFNYQSFSRAFSLPDYADENNVNANYKDGILHLEIAKKEGATNKSAKTIAVK